MSKLTDSIKTTKVDVPCPKCGHKFKTSLQDAMNCKKVICPHCDTEIQLKPDNKIKSQLDMLEKSFKKLGLK